MGTKEQEEEDYAAYVVEVINEDGNFVEDLDEILLDLEAAPAKLDGLKADVQDLWNKLT